MDVERPFKALYPIGNPRYKYISTFVHEKKSEKKNSSHFRVATKLRDKQPMETEII